MKITIDKNCCKGCGICLAICPKGIFIKSKKRNNYGTNMPEASKEQTCVFCRMCERQCPDGAIDVKKEEN
ncbi:4Fe-4S binding protein [Ihubacter massiliensis]|uniref:4Fe-4S binding protein n=1 Tax=Hominibacterium faecale TaxID=2839743 RepID=A0A9J6QS78_9FIRM|nr:MULTISPECIES: 4Fe-4S binding protein [Eubacteriales Family XIII. Incertae Sedis]MCC2864559.1 4Fe-4S binding protein [Anaerovorax odorimutans]MCI7303599.1 4Fe-4S binding protein [Clostridia bacterium]MDE8733540.1 4Fe-4S binding protein [Eubacteriales bacterium DFI.9.88]MDY3011225.1 4Fe-4S binding protein [Clostridiales Family XIII bacterium]MCO7123926.1 4Fe-4S binding protein [Ihubacter massiliensis]